MLELSSIEKVFHRGTINETRLFHNFNLTIDPGAFVTVVGSNGSGKTTLLNIISGALPVDSGTVKLNGTDITNQPEYRRAAKIGRVFQDSSIGTVPGMTIYENLAIAENKGNPYTFARALNRKKFDDYRSIVAALGIGLEEKMNVPVGLLSGGQRQALSLIMSTMTPIDLLLLDEHTAALDPKTAEVIMQLTGKLVKEKQLTVLMVTHNLRYAVEYGNRILMMHRGQIVLDERDEQKEKKSVKDLLQLFNEISVECGN